MGLTADLPIVEWDVNQVPTIDFYFYLLFKNTFHDLVIKIFRIFRYKLTEKSEKYEKKLKRKSVFCISHLSPSIRNEKF